MCRLKEDYNLKEYYKKIVKDTQKIYNELIKWSDEDKKEFKELLDHLEEPFDKTKETTKEKGNRLEKVIKFIIDKTYFFEVYQDIRTDTNEIDEIAVLSDKGRQALYSFGINREIIPLEDIFIGECKNYEESISVTYVGKFYSLMKSSGMSIGILFSKNGITGESNGYKDAYELIKMLRIVEKEAKGNDLYIITFSLEDYKMLLEGKTFFEIVKAKKIALQVAADYSKFLKDNTHSAEEKISEVITNYRIQAGR